MTEQMKRITAGQDAGHRNLHRLFERMRPAVTDAEVRRAVRRGADAELEGGEGRPMGEALPALRRRLGINRSSK